MLDVSRAGLRSDPAPGRDIGALEPEFIGYSKSALSGSDEIGAVAARKTPGYLWYILLAMLWPHLSYHLIPSANTRRPPNRHIKARAAAAFPASTLSQTPLTLYLPMDYKYENEIGSKKRVDDQPSTSGASSGVDQDGKAYKLIKFNYDIVIIVRTAGPSPMAVCLV